MATMIGHESRRIRLSTRGPGPRPSDPLDYLSLSDPLADIDVDDLARHIIVCHHRYAREISGVIEGWLEILIGRHGDRHPELTAVAGTFVQLARELRAAMTREERTVFPAIATCAVAERHHGTPACEALVAIGDAIGLAEREEAAIVALTQQLRAHTRRYRVPEDGCLTFRLCYEELERFDADLVRHIYLERRILYPRAIESGWLLP